MRRKGSWIGIWVDAFEPGFKTPSECDRLIDDALYLGAHALFVQMRKRADTYFRLSLEPFADDPAVPGDFDPLAYLEKGLRSRGVELHLWINALPVWRSQDPIPTSPHHLFHTHGPSQSGLSNWLTCDEQGTVNFESGYFLDPGHPAVANYLATIVSDLLTRYRADGVHLDHIRYPPQDSRREGFGVGYNPESIRRFNLHHGRTGLPCRNDPLWSQWRRDQVTTLVRTVREVVKESSPSLCFSAALIAWGDGPTDLPSFQLTAAYNRVFQDWPAWVTEGLLDLGVPMNYDRDADSAERGYFERWIRFENQLSPENIAFGLGSFLNSPIDLARQISFVCSTTERHRVVFYSYAALKQGSRTSLSELKHLLG